MQTKTLIYVGFLFLEPATSPANVWEEVPNITTCSAPELSPFMLRLF